MTYFTYILKSQKTNAYYIGCTENIAARLERHNAGRVISTKQARPWTLCASEAFPNQRDALFRERQIKSWKSRAAIERFCSPENRGSSIRQSRIGTGSL